MVTLQVQPLIGPPPAAQPSTVQATSARVGAAVPWQRSKVPVVMTEIGVAFDWMIRMA
jgi:hypothetical protein